ncbi:hypothetical protein IWX90DRAFT_411960 [Phyllosticta citrichinensis]|uniref:Uncharacterized protein n=1 Tax=Phyllosticta citrichinensis TaxID=1130410 RepID=A0ABR1Y3B0_9PEZI
MDDILLEDLMASPIHARDQQNPEASAQPCSTTASLEGPDLVPIIPFDLPNHIIRPHAGECQCLWCWRPMLSLQDQSPRLEKRSFELTFPHPEDAIPDPKLNIGAPVPFPPNNTTLSSVSADESYSWHLFPSKRPPSGVYTARTLSLATNLVPVLVYTPRRSRSPSAVEENPTLWGMSEEALYEAQRTEAEDDDEEEEEEDEEEKEEYDFDLLSAYPQAYQDYLEESMSSIGSSTLREVNEGASNSDDDDDDDDDNDDNDDNDDDGSVASTAVKSTASLAREDGMLEQKESPRPSADSISTTPLPPPVLSDPSRWSESTGSTTPSPRSSGPNDTDDADADADADDENEDEDDKDGGRDESPIVPMQLWQWPRHERFLDPHTPTPRPPSPFSPFSSSPSFTSPHPPPPSQFERFLTPRTPPTPPRPSPTAAATPSANPAPRPASSSRPISDARTSLVARCGSVSGGGGGGGRRAGFRRGFRNVWGKLIGGVRRKGG